MNTTTRYRSDRQTQIARLMLRAAGMEIMRGWHEDAGIPANELDPEMDIQDPGDIDHLHDVAGLLTAGMGMPSGYADAEEWSWVRQGMQIYVDGLELEGS